MTTSKCEREYDFALVLSGVTELTTAVEDALYEVGCSDATLSISYGRLFMEFSRKSLSLKDALLSAIRDVRRSGINADVLQVDECNFVTQSEIARRIDRSRQQVHQYITGQRGPGGFPPPVCHLREETPLWQWCAVSFWLCENNMIRPEETYDAEVVFAINTALESAQQRCRNRELVEEVTKAITACARSNDQTDGQVTKDGERNPRLIDRHAIDVADPRNATQG